MGKARIKICLGQYTKPIYESLLAESMQPAPANASVSVYSEGECVIILMKAKGVSKLRAIINSYMYLIYAAYNVLTLTSPRRETHLNPDV